MTKFEDSKETAAVPWKAQMRNREARRAFRTWAPPWSNSGLASRAIVSDGNSIGFVEEQIIGIQPRQFSRLRAGSCRAYFHASVRRFAGASTEQLQNGFSAPKVRATHRHVVGLVTCRGSAQFAASGERLRAEGQSALYSGAAFIVVRDGKIAALYVCHDWPPL
jgi:hypothetical protein